MVAGGAEEKRQLPFGGIGPPLRGRGYRPALVTELHYAPGHRTSLLADMRRAAKWAFGPTQVKSRAARASAAQSMAVSTGASVQVTPSSVSPPRRCASAPGPASASERTVGGTGMRPPIR